LIKSSLQAVILN